MCPKGIFFFNVRIFMEINVQTYYTKQISLPFTMRRKKNAALFKREGQSSSHTTSNMLLPALKLSPLVTSHPLNSWQLLVIMAQCVALNPSMSLPFIKGELDLFPTFKASSAAEHQNFLSPTEKGKQTLSQEVIEERFSSISSSQTLEQFFLNSPTSSLEKNIEFSTYSHMAVPASSSPIEFNTRRSHKAEPSFRDIFLETRLSSSASASRAVNPVLGRSLHPIAYALPFLPIRLEDTSSPPAISAPYSKRSISGIAFETSSFSEHPVMNLWQRFIDNRRARGRKAPKDLQEWKTRAFATTRQSIFFPWVLQTCYKNIVAHDCNCSLRINGEWYVAGYAENNFWQMSISLLKLGLLSESDILTATNLQPSELEGIRDLPGETLMRSSGSSPAHHDWELF